jgi:hypothetical protein
MSNITDHTKLEIYPPDIDELVEVIKKQWPNLVEEDGYTDAMIAWATCAGFNRFISAVVESPQDYLRSRDDLGYFYDRALNEARKLTEQGKLV